MIFWWFQGEKKPLIILLWHCKVAWKNWGQNIFISVPTTTSPPGISWFKTKNGNTGTTREIRPSELIINFKQISYVDLVFPLFTLNKQMSAGLGLPGIL